MLNKHINMLIDIAKHKSLQINNVEIKQVSQIEMNDLMVKGYENRPFITNAHNSSYVPEMFVIGNPHYIYLNVENDFELNLLSVAHALAHVDLANRHIVLKRLSQYKTEIDKDLIPFVKELIQIEGKERVESLVRRIRMIYEYISSPIHDYILPLERKSFSKSINNTFTLNYRHHFFEEIIHRSTSLKEWEKQLARLLILESVYFYGIRKTKLVNEGWASFWQMKLLKELPLKISEKLQLATLEAQMHKKDNVGLNIYSLGKRLWEQVPRDQLFEKSKTEIDLTMLSHYYNDFVHTREQISFIRKEQETGQYLQSNHFERVKNELIQFHLFQKPLLMLDDDLTRKSGYVTLRYVNEPYEISITQLNQFKEVISYLLKEKVYVKPYSLPQYNNVDKYNS